MGSPGGRLGSRSESERAATGKRPAAGPDLFPPRYSPLSNDRPHPPADTDTALPAPAPRSGRLSALVGQSFIYGLGGILARVAGIFLVPVYLVAAGTEAFGVAELVTSAVAVAAIVLRFGIVNSMSRFTLGEGPTGDWSPVVHTIYTFVLSVSTAATVVGLLVREQIADLLDVSETVASVGVVGLWITMNYDVLARLYRIERRASAFVAFQLTNVAVTVILTVVLVVVLDKGAVGLLLGNFAGTGAVYLLMLWARRRSVGIRRADPTVARELLQFSLPLMPANVAIWALNLADRIMLQRLAGPLELGQYAAASRVAAGMAVLLAAFQAAWTPFAHALRGEEGDEVAKRTYAEVLTFWSVAMGWGLAAVTLLSAPYIALTFPESAQDAISVVPLLATGIVLYGAYLIVGLGVAIVKRTRMTPVIACTAGAVNIGLNFWFIPHLGLVGAGITTVIGFGLLVLLQWLNARRLYPIAYEWGRLARVAAWTAAVVALSVWVIPESGAAGIVTRIALVLAYPLGLLAVRAVSRADLRGAASLLRRRRRTGPVETDELGEPPSP
jgi:O-antigen/teichoic acid export membrane protein